MLTNNNIVIVNNKTEKAVCELHNPKLADKLNTKKYKAVPILEYLQGLNN